MQNITKLQELMSDSISSNAQILQNGNYNSQDDGGDDEIEIEYQTSSSSSSVNYNLNYNPTLNQQELQNKEQEFEYFNREKQLKVNGKCNKTVLSSNSKLAIKYTSHHHKNGNGIVLTHNINRDRETTPTPTRNACNTIDDDNISIKLKENKNFCCGEHNNDDQQIDLEHENGNKLNDNSSTGSVVSKLFHCFPAFSSVFKARKISYTSSTQPSEEDNKEQIPDLLKPPSQQSSTLHRNMTDLDLYLQELADTSEILDRADTKNLSTFFPPRAIGNCWEKAFSTTTDGFSLHNLYRKLDCVDYPVILAIQDIENRVFGALCSCGFKVSEKFYGNCDTFLFRLRPEFEVFKFSGENLFFIQGQDSFISIGSDDGRYGLWLDDNLYLGRTEACSTFKSPALVPEKDFKIKTVECWTVGLV